ncbi:hypothetical protein PG999_004996 [Apiospora kogelbergensis]|uniref:Rhodopsin domain-containing protein n=1 Tax=Apiospora kogelbergensis TaxID=1337665 RepID=A0AAW0R0W4_9PEZI
MESRQPEIYVAVTVTLIASTTALILRLVARRWKKLALWFDDYLAIIAWGCPAQAAALAYDIGAYICELAPSRTYEMTPAPKAKRRPHELAGHYRELFQFLLEQAYTVSIAASQLSLLALYWRAFGPVAENRIFIVTFQCNPPEAKWSYSAAAAKNCPIDTGKFFLATVTTHLIIDVLLMLLPAWQIRKLRLPLLEKISITALFLFGCVYSVLLFSQDDVCGNRVRRNLQRRVLARDGPGNVVRSRDQPKYCYRWAILILPLYEFMGLEPDSGPNSACLPLMRPLFQRLGCCMDRKASAASQRQDSYEMTKLPSTARAVVQTLENVTIGHPTQGPGTRAASVNDRTFWPSLTGNGRPENSRRHTTEPARRNWEVL